MIAFGEVLELAFQQHNIVTRGQIRKRGASRDQITRWLGAGLLVRVYESVYRIGGTAETWQSRVLAACWAGGDQRMSVASHRCALAFGNLPGGVEHVEITSLRHRRARHEGVITHESRQLEDRDVMYVDGIPMTRTARTLCDVAALVGDGSLAKGTLQLAIVEAYRRNLVDAPRLMRTWQRLGGTRRPGGALMEQLVTETPAPPTGLASTPESMALLAIRAASLPEPTLQHRVWVSDTQRFDLDLAWPEIRYGWEVSPWWYHGRTREQHDHDGSRRLLFRDAGWDYDVATDAEIDSGFPTILRVLEQRLLRADASIDRE